MFFGAVVCGAGWGVSPPVAGRAGVSMRRAAQQRLGGRVHAQPGDGGHGRRHVCGQHHVPSRGSDGGDDRGGIRPLQAHADADARPGERGGKAGGGEKKNERWREEGREVAGSMMAGFGGG